MFYAYWKIALLVGVEVACADRAFGDEVTGSWE
jgi:hypothetical protein